MFGKPFSPPRGTAARRLLVAGSMALVLAVFGLSIIACGGGADSGSPTIPAAVLLKIEVTNNPQRYEYALNATALDTSGLEVTATYDNDEEIVIDNSNLAFTGYNLAEPGIQEVTITYQSKTATFEIKVLDEGEIPELLVTEIAIKTEPTKTSYHVGGTLDLTGLVLTVTYEDDSEEDVIWAADAGILATGFSSTAIGEKTVTISYRSKTATFTVNVVDAIITGISVKTQPANIDNYYIGDTLNLAGLVLTATFDDGSTDDIPYPNAGITHDFDSTSAGQKTVTITYQGQTAQITITVNPGAPTVTGISVKTQPTKLQYFVGDPLDLTGLVLTATLSNDTNRDVTYPDAGISTTGFNSAAAAANQTVTISYEGQTAEITVTIIGPFATVAEVSAYLATATGGTTVANPILVQVEITEIMTTAWADLLTALNAAGKYVSLDLSKSTVGTYDTPIGTDGVDTALTGELVFNPYLDNAGAGRIVNLTLPSNATHISGQISDYQNTAFRYFAVLQTVTGQNVTFIARNAFQEANNTTPTLKSVVFPNVVTIIEEAFRGCTQLESVTILTSDPVSFQPIDVTGNPIVFNTCTNLKNLTISGTATQDTVIRLKTGIPTITTVTVAPGTGNTWSIVDGMILRSGGLFWLIGATGDVVLPATITAIAANAFDGNKTVTSITGPNVTSIDPRAFQNSVITSASFPVLTVLGGDANFLGCADLATLSIPSVTSITGTWLFAATGNTALTIIMGATAPTFAAQDNLFGQAGNNPAGPGKVVTVEYPSGGAGGYDAAWTTAFTNGNAANVTITPTPVAP